MKQWHIAVIEDDAITRDRLTSYFKQEGYQVSAAENAVQLKEIMVLQRIDLILLDINLPDENGLLLTRQLRERSDIGIILVTGRTDSVDRIVGLEMGADDYVTKPIELRELSVRVKNLLWRMALVEQAEINSLTPDNDKVVRFEQYVLDIPKRQLWNNDQQVKLTRSEFELLLAFTRYPQQVLNRERLLSMMTHRNHSPDERTIDVLVRRLRNKLHADLFTAIHGEGYLFVADVE
ncbi:TorCAD operon transcriptional regulatory protein torR [Pragia fontium]|uniref:Two-component system, OmpR family, torCAD operon response regulator TorR n=2 Tax=Pragia fontium TaxID=82985 RepID=A0AAJ4WA26_9GAMM|nr:two-component system response regulator TorR [Pragia fontium]GKX63475.1 two-component system response regulator TorR [Pragia fontium]SFC65480.1 two-component system, OmpR family, torCAD operon response regulator TorR [Pragia fontium DSM 5563 = ATCC 49100]SUB83585.1 TorCAD operon transcriptional regulatory protein torR [Pragia fontium]